ncbi:MAG: hypothetical protein ABIR96_00260 [Bdellovibrionota bacterium]
MSRSLFFKRLLILGISGLSFFKISTGANAAPAAHGVSITHDAAPVTLATPRKDPLWGDLKWDTLPPSESESADVIQSIRADAQTFSERLVSKETFTRRDEDRLPAIKTEDTAIKECRRRSTYQQKKLVVGSGWSAETYNEGLTGKNADGNLSIGLGSASSYGKCLRYTGSSVLVFRSAPVWGDRWIEKDTIECDQERSREDQETLFRYFMCRRIQKTVLSEKVSESELKWLNQMAVAPELDCSNLVKKVQRHADRYPAPKLVSHSEKNCIVSKTE